MAEKIMKNKTKTTKIMNGETVNYTLAALFSFLFLIALKQLLKTFFGVSAQISALTGFIAAEVLFYLLEKRFVFTKKCLSSNVKQALILLLRIGINLGLCKIPEFFFGSILGMQTSFCWLSAFILIFFFNYFFDRLILFDCIAKAKEIGGGRIFRLFYRNRYVCAAVGGAAVCITVVYIIFKLFPFGDTTVMRMDLYHQYGPLFAELYDRIVNGDSLIYSWTSGGGSSFIGNYFNYLSSPLTGIIFLFDRKDISYAITTLVSVKCILSAGTFTFYLKKSQKQHSYLTASFGIFYAFSAYFLAYYWNIMWIDGMILLPLIALGIETIIYKGDGRIYIGSLFILFFSSYYMAYMSCIFSVLYFLAYFAIHYSFTDKIDNRLIFSKKYSWKYLWNNTFFNRGVRFAFSAIAGACLCAFTLIPVYFILSQCSATSDDFPTVFSSYFDLFDLLTSHLTSLETTIRSSGDDVLPNIYCGILAIVLVPLYLINKKIGFREKCVYILLLLFFVFSFDNNVMNFIWHAFHFPNDLPYRFSYMYSFIILIVAFRGLTKIRFLSTRDITLVGMLWIFFILIAQKLTTTKMAEQSIYISIAFVIIWSGVLCLIRKGLIKKMIAGLTVLTVTLCEVIIADSNSYAFSQNNADYAAKYDAYEEAILQLEDEDCSFYRTELCELVTRMDPCYYSYNGMSVFSSMAYETYSRLQYSLGMFGNRINSYTYHPQTAVYNMMFGLKYLIQDQDSTAPAERYFTEIFKTDDNVKVYENNYYLPIAYCTGTALESWETQEGNPFQLQSDYFELATGYSGVFLDVIYNQTEYDNLTGDVFTSNGTFWFDRLDDNSQYGFIDITITPAADGEVYVYLTSPDVTDVEFFFEDSENITQNIDEPYMIDLGYHKVGEKITISVDGGGIDGDSSYISIYAYTLNETVFESGYQKLKNASLNITDYSGTEINGTITADQNSYLYTSIPYDKGWSVSIDGEEVSTFSIGDCLLAAAVKPGTHSVTLRYRPRGLKEGTVISCASLVSIIGYFAVKKKKYTEKGNINF